MSEEVIQTAAEEAKVEEAELLKEDIANDEVDTEKEDLRAELETERAAKEKRKTRAQRGYEKAKESGTLWKWISEDKVNELVEKKFQAINQKQTLLTKYPDAAEKLAEVEKISAEKKLSLEDSYWLLKFNESQSGKTDVHGSFARINPSQDDDAVAKILNADHRAG